MTKRRKFSAEFKLGAVEQASQPGLSCAQVTREFGIRDCFLIRWKREVQSDDYQRYLAANGLVCSMSAVGHAVHNAVCEGFFVLLKRERSSTLRSGRET